MTGVTPLRREPVEYVLEHWAPVQLMNHVLRSNWRTHQQLKEAWRDAGTLLGKSLPKLQIVEIDVEHYAGKEIKRLPDCLACAPSVKAFIDGLVIAGVVADDSTRYVNSVTLEPPKRGPKSGLRFYIREV